HGDVLQALRPARARRHAAQGRPLRLRARVHGQGPPPRDPHLRGADLVRRSRAERGQEDHLARRRRRPVDAREVPVRGLVPASEADTRWAAVVINYEAGSALCDCVRSLLADTSAGRAPQVVVVDNGSSDGSAATVARSLPAVTVLDPGANLGYARAANLGIAATDAPVVAVCNPDFEVQAGTARGPPGPPDPEGGLRAARPPLPHTHPTLH